MAFRYTENFDSLQAGDLLGVQRLYGPANEDSGNNNIFDSDPADKPIELTHANKQGDTNAPVTGVLGIGGKEGPPVP